MAFCSNLAKMTKTFFGPLLGPLARMADCKGLIQDSTSGLTTGPMRTFIKSGLDIYVRMKTTIDIVNVVASTKLAEAFDLLKIEAELEGASYDKKKFPGLVYRVKAPKAAFLIFTSGKIVCTGSKSIEDVRTVINAMAKTLKSIGFEDINLEPEIHVQNIVASADLKTDLNLNAVALGLGLENIEYEPEQFPGLVYRIKRPKVVVLIFSSGKLVITGGKSPEECEEGARIVRMQLENMGLL
jgi:transcription initiation factor TFIID TATA-box-binding protein